MPHCQLCKEPTLAEDLVEHISTGALLCEHCVLPNGPKEETELDFNYGFSYSNKRGLSAAARLGKATINLHIPQEELIKVFG